MDQPEQPHENASLGCGILGRHPILAVIAFAGMGIGVGVGFSSWEPDDPETKEIVLTWVGLFGDLFIRVLKAAVLPLVFVNVVISVVDMMMIGRASSVGVTTIILYTFTTVIASIVGLISIVMFKNSFDQGVFDEETIPMIQLGCTSEGSLLMESADDGSLMCVDAANASSPFTQFEIIDVSAGLSTTDSSFTQLSISDTIYQGVFMKLITDNILYSFVDGNFAAVVLFAIVFGASLGRVMFEKKLTELTASSIVCVFQEVGDVLLKIINWIIACTPFAVLSLIANAIGSQDDLSGAFKNVGFLIASCLIGFLIHFIVTDIGFFYVASGGRVNPFTYLPHIVPAQMTALACASSAATLPVTLRCVKDSGMVADDIRNFVCPLGATINMDGSAIYFPCACIWLAYLNGIEPNAGSYFLLIILATVGSAGTAPVPSSGLVLVITAYNTVFGTSGTPAGFEFVVAIDWFLDRCVTALNVTGDSVVSCIVSARTPMDVDAHKDATNITKGSDGEEEPVSA